ncbi:M10 family metallopeptidase C-terminal domain-containing protein [Oxalobacteraceae bacterium OTU3REALA1]|nr:M10 family metallopeptidase C-terminal domain-containing protein [Oxalobacteraceae bacterium OTU3REALA1]
MSTPTTSSPTSFVPNKGAVLIDALLSGYKWGGATGSGATITYSFPWTTAANAVYAGPGNTAYSQLNEPAGTQHFGLTAVQQAAAAAALGAWSGVANIAASLIQESSTVVGDVRLAWTSAAEAETDGSTAWGWAYYPNSQRPSGGDIWLHADSSAATDSDWSTGSYNYMSLIHELGHALGLKHPFEDGTVLAPQLANRQYSVMAYDSAPHALFVDVTVTATERSWQAYEVVPDTPMLYDIATIQYMYGANMSYRTGNDTYTFDTETPFLRTIWDAGGNDTISIANFSAGSVIDLQQGHYSSIRIPSDSGAGINWTRPPPAATYDGTDNLAIAFGAVIENAIGGAGNDTLIGNDIANRLQGNGGSNAIDGGAGIDTAVYSGNFSAYAIAASGNGGYTVTSRANPAQSDTLTGIERLALADGTLSLGVAGLADDPLQAQYVALAQKFYVGYFGRPADAGGLANMVAQFAAAKVPTTIAEFTSAYQTDSTVRTLVNGFGNSAESAALYHGTNKEFVTAIYQHLLGRAPAAEGLNFWSNALDADNGLARGLAALSIMSGAERNTTPQGLIDAALIANRVTVAANFTASLDQPREVAGYAGAIAAGVARAMLDGVDQNTSVIAYQTTVLNTTNMLAAGVAAGAPEVVLVGVGSFSHDPAFA